MKRKNTFSQILFSGIWISLLLFFPGCTDEYGMDGESGGETATVTLDLQVPGAFVGMQTKSMGTAQEKVIHNLQVLIFEETASGEEVFRNIGEVTQRSDTQVTLTLPVSKAKYRFVVLANADAQTIADGTSKQEALNRFAFDCAGQWPTGDQSYIPMWGEYGETLSIEKDKSITLGLHRALARVDVGLLFKPQTQDNQTEEVEGLENFKITSVRVYRTKNKAYVVSSADRMNADKSEVTTPNIHPEAKYNSNDGTQAYETMAEADKDPLLYKVTPASDSYLREIYIPESTFYDKEPANTGMDNVPCLVIGGYYGKDNSSEETFYRVDFADYQTEGGVSTVTAYKHVLRNHRYVFNIRSVSSSGFKEPDQALHSVNTKMELTVLDWNEVPLNYHITGNYFFQIERREVWLEAKAPEGKTFIGLTIPYRTNIPLVLEDEQGPDIDLKKLKNVTLSFADEEIGFRSVLLIDDYTNSEETQYPGKTILIGIYMEDEGGVNEEEKHDVLTVQVENLQFTIDVYQKAATVEYDLLCDQTVVHGKYREGVPLNYTNYLEVTIQPTIAGSATLADFKQERIEIVSEIRKGIHFEYQGTLQDGLADGTVKEKGNTYIIKLRGEGTPVKDLNDRMNPDTEEGILTRIDELRINTNAKNGAFCENTSIIFGYRTKKILAIGANAGYRYGYQLEPNTGSRAFVDASINFGVDPNSAVTMEQFPNNYTHPGDYPNKSDAGARGNAFHIEYITTGRGIGVGDKIDYTYLETMVNVFQPDIILTGQAIQYQTEDIGLFNEFIDNGGVFLMFNEYYPSAASINAMVEKVMGSGNLGGSNKTISYDDIVYQILDVEDEENPEDPILRGPFSDRDAQGKAISLAYHHHWGSDGIALHGFSEINRNNAYVYSTRQYDDDAASVFRHKTKPFFYIGDGGFLSNSKRYIGNSYQGNHVYCPFAINSVYQPVDRINYTNNKNQKVCNSRFFGNILAWAVDYAEHHPIEW